ncbi:Fur-regulated basic protein FbpA [Neobacillus bataviensis]|uniref:Fur-regulated basic protein FbpA n=1 Tax=Neobacillus bataviensis TaxID=220685 RepID=UPI001CBAE3A1|nr:Fur-regulated basic protein FbpA [Neobacillus bataviensis]
MKNNLRNACQQKRQHLIDELLKLGVFKKNNKHLYEWTLQDLEEEYVQLKQVIWIQTNPSAGKASQTL